MFILENYGTLRGTLKKKPKKMLANDFLKNKSTLQCRRQKDQRKTS